METKTHKSLNDLNIYITQVSITMQCLKNFDPSKKNALKPFDDKINRFLQQHANMKYADLVTLANSQNFNTGGYALLEKSALKRRLFDYRARVYISALANCEEQGCNIDELVESIKINEIPPIKKEINEPTYGVIYQVLSKQRAQ